MSYTAETFRDSINEQFGERAGKYLGRFLLDGVEVGYLTDGRITVARPLPSWPSTIAFPESLGVDCLPAYFAVADGAWREAVTADLLREWCAGGPIGEVQEPCHCLDGECVCDDCNHAHTCGDCDGAGTVTADPDPRPGIAGEYAFNRVLVGRALCMLEADGDVAVTVASFPGNVAGLVIRCSSGSAIVTQMNNDETADADPFPVAVVAEPQAGDPAGVGGGG